MDPLIITVAGIGAELTREQQPNLPITPEEIGEDAARCREAGAAIYHLHVRTPDGAPTMDVGAFAAARDAVRASCDIVVQFTSGGGVHDTVDDRIAPLSLRPEMASLTTSTVNFGDDVFFNPLPLVRSFYVRMRELGIVPEFEIFEPGGMATADAVFSQGNGDHHRHYDFVLGVPGAMPAWTDSIAFLARHLPAGATWSATGIGRKHFEVAATAVELGGHVRTGFEDARYLGPGEPAASNAQLVEKVRGLGAAAGREPATPAVAREILGLRGTLAS